MKRLKLRPTGIIHTAQLDERHGNVVPESLRSNADEAEKLSLAQEQEVAKTEFTPFPPEPPSIGGKVSFFHHSALLVELNAHSACSSAEDSTTDLSPFWVSWH